MKLLFDQNLSFQLKNELSGLFPESIHVKDIGLDRATDTKIWNYEKDHDFIIVSKDSDFHQRSLLFGSPPKVVWIRKGNCSAKEIIDLISGQVELIRSFIENEESSFFMLG